MCDANFGPAAEVCVMLINAPIAQHMVISLLARITLHN